MPSSERSSHKGQNDQRVVTGDSLLRGTEAPICWPDLTVESLLYSWGMDLGHDGESSKTVKSDCV